MEKYKIEICQIVWTEPRAATASNLILDHWKLVLKDHDEKGTWPIPSYM